MCHVLAHHLSHTAEVNQFGTSEGVAEAGHPIDAGANGSQRSMLPKGPPKKRALTRSLRDLTLIRQMGRVKLVGHAPEVERRAGTKGNADGKARTGLSARLACHRRRDAYGDCLPFGPEVGAVCGKAARTVLGSRRSCQSEGKAARLLERREKGDQTARRRFSIGIFGVTDVSIRSTQLATRPLRRRSNFPSS